MSPWNREFKISGQIGEPGQKDKLTFSSLAHQIEHGLSREVSELKIVDAVIRAIAPGMQLRSYLEGKPNLSSLACQRTISERQSKKKLLAQQQHPKLHSVQATEVSAEKKEKTSCHKSTEKREPDILSELKEIRTEMVLLKDLSVEVSQIKESIRQPQAIPTQCSTRVRDQAVTSPQSAYPSQGYVQPYGRRGEAF
ncbi:Flavin-dependent thymidylate synthase [Labeo rohita]|uniref:Flavin-dependent thymidylate synthase n=1 Tax=Labeo rohita TaxID=84645 RepID=A0ABQ8L5S8_LABRO|nr:Flavin-dependent thymidylate synthase [Labeo rohita]